MYMDMEFLSVILASDTYGSDEFTWYFATG